MTAPTPSPHHLPPFEDLLALPTLDAQVRALQAAHMLDANGLAALLDQAAQLVRSDPARGLQLATLCAALAPHAGAPALVPRAQYLCAQAHAMNAEFDAALALVDAARQGFIAQGEPLEALRTNVGRMGVLLDLARYREVLDLGEHTTRHIAVLGHQDAIPAEMQLLVALVQQNMGICYEQLGRYDEALRAYAVSEQQFKLLEMPERIGDIRNNRGLVLLGLGRGRDALAAFEAAATIFERAGQTLLHAQTLLNIGDAHLLLSHYTRSLTAFQQARSLFEALHALADQHILLLDTADAYLALNLYPEALTAYREAAAMLRSLGMSHDLARALWGMGAALSAQAQYASAESALVEAAAIFAFNDNLPFQAHVLLEQSALETARGQSDAAQALAQQALALVATRDWPVQHIYAHLRLADLALPDATQAEMHLHAAAPLVERLALPPLRYRLSQRLGHVRLLQTRADDAQLLLEAAVEEIEGVRGTLAHETLRSAFLHDKTAAYADLVQLHLDRGDQASIWSAFGVAERAKSRALVDLLTGVRNAADEPQAESQQMALEADLHATYSELFRSASAADSAERVAELRAQAIRLEQTISRVRLQHAPAQAGPDVLAQPLPFDAVRAQLASVETLLAYHIVGDEINVFVWRRGAMQVVRRVGSLQNVQRLLQRLDMQWERFRVGGAFVGQHVALLEQSAQRVLAALYTALVAPLAVLLDLPVVAGVSAPPLTIVPHGALHQVPFHALFDGAHYLIERCEIAYVPSATVLAVLAQRPPRPPSRALVMGVPDPSIPAVADEVQRVAEQLDAPTVRLAEQATLAALRADAGQYAHLHLACHGLFRSDNPIFSALKLHDGWLSAADVLQLDLSGAQVVLSACESGRSQVLGGDEILGLTRAFLGAGASTLVVSLWLAQDATTAALMATYYAKLAAQLRPAAALRAAQLALKANYAHPFYWAPFILVGQR